MAAARAACHRRYSVLPRVVERAAAAAMVYENRSSARARSVLSLGCRQHRKHLRPSRLSDAPRTIAAAGRPELDVEQRLRRARAADDRLFLFCIPAVDGPPRIVVGARGGRDVTDGRRRTGLAQTTA